MTTCRNCSSRLQGYEKDGAGLHTEKSDVAKGITALDLDWLRVGIAHDLVSSAAETAIA